MISDEISLNFSIFFVGNQQKKQFFASGWERGIGPWCRAVTFSFSHLHSNALAVPDLHLLGFSAVRRLIFLAESAHHNGGLSNLAFRWQEGSRWNRHTMFIICLAPIRRPGDLPSFDWHQFETRVISQKGPNVVFARTVKRLAFGKGWKDALFLRTR